HRLKLSVRFIELEGVVPDLNRRVQHVSFGRSWHVARDHSAKRVLQKWNHPFRITQMQVRLYAWHSLRTRSPSLYHRDVPQIPERISYRSLPVARDVIPDFVNGTRTRTYGPREGRICIVHVQMNRRGSRGDLLIRVGQFDNRISDGHLRVHQQTRSIGNRDAEALRSAKRVLQEFDELRRSRHDDIRRNRVIAAGKSLRSLGNLTGIFGGGSRRACHGWCPLQ